MTPERRNPAMHFRLVSNFLDSLLKLITVKQFWRNKEDIVNLVNFLHERYSSSVTEDKRKLTRFFPVALILLYTSNAVNNWIVGSGVMISDSTHGSWSLHNWWVTMAEAGQFNFFIRRDVHIKAFLPGDGHVHNFSGFEIFLGVLAAVQYLGRRLWGVYTDLFILMIVLTIHTAASSFAKKLKATQYSSQIAFDFEVVPPPPPPGSPCNANHLYIEMEKPTKPWPSEWQEILMEYKYLKQLARMINNIIGTNMTCLISFSILYFATSLDEVFLKKDVQDFGKIFRVICFYCNHIAILLTAADVCSQMATLEEWMSEEKNRKVMSFQDAHYICRELDQSVVSVKSSNVFPVTYSLVANIISTMVTYFIICVQYISTPT